MRFVIITGLSGAGKSQALRQLEDIGYFCIDNLPPLLMPNFAEFCLSNSDQITNAGMVIDSRSGNLEDLDDALQMIISMGISYEIFFLDARDEYLIRRFKGTRRIHPLSRDCSLEEAISKERGQLQYIKGIANHVIDTSTYTVNQLNQIIEEFFGSKYDEDDGILISVSTFGYKRGIPLDADMVLDVRFLPNPYYVEELKPYSGKNELVKKYIFEFPQASMYLDKLLDLVQFLLPLYKQQGKNQLMIAIGCTGGMHRSVAIAELLYEKLKLKGNHVIIGHRDIGLDLNK